jgi:hypothetical protein
VPLCTLCGKRNITTENAEKHGEKNSVNLCALCGKKNTTTENAEKHG